MITSRENPQVKLAIRLRESARERRERGLFFLEGYRLCADALASGFESEVLFITEAAQTKHPIVHKNVTLISESVAKKLADTQNPQGIFGIFRYRGGNLPPAATQNKIIALENLQDPANLGAIARTAEALGLSCLVVSGGCDVYHPKALRASMGALLRIPVMQTDDFPAFLRESALPCYASIPNGPASTLLFPDSCIVVIGNEGNGLSEDAIAACGYQLTIPMAGRAESLNAAAAATIIAWEMMKASQGRQSAARA